MGTKQPAVLKAVLVYNHVEFHFPLEMKILNILSVEYF
jgi:hypothetical protein